MEFRSPAEDKVINYLRYIKPTLFTTTQKKTAHNSAQMDYLNYLLISLDTPDKRRSKTYQKGRTGNVTTEPPRSQIKLTRPLVPGFVSCVLAIL